MLSFKLFDNWACEGSYVVIEMNDRKFTKTTKDYEPDQGECGTPEFVEGNLIGEHKDDMSFEDVVLWFCDHQPVFCRDYALCQLIEHYVAQRDGYNDAQAKKDALRDAARKERVRLRAIAKAEAKLVQLKAGV